METRKLALECPQCASTEVYYTCTPNCCFNHVCGDCRTTFEPVTTPTGETITGVTPPEAPPEDADPAVACAKCDATTVFRMADDRLVCAACGAVLTLVFTEVVPG